MDGVVDREGRLQETVAFGGYGNTSASVVITCAVETPHLIKPLDEKYWRLLASFLHSSKRKIKKKKGMSIIIKVRRGKKSYTMISKRIHI